MKPVEPAKSYTEMYRRPMDAKGELQIPPLPKKSRWQAWLDSWWPIAKQIINKEIK